MEIIDKMYDCDIQYRWYAFSSSDYIEESDSIELLTHIVSLWLTIRGFSISKAWMEDYKIKTATTTRAKKSLRKELSKSSVASDNKQCNSHSYHSYITHVCTYILYNYN